MFDLEKSITEWRKQMLAAGIKTPVPLEELESHLREEIGQQMKSGSNEQEILNSAVKKIGKTHELKAEFSKIKKLEARENMKNSRIVSNLSLAVVLLATAWLVFSAAMIGNDLFLKDGLIPMRVSDGAQVQVQHGVPVLQGEETVSAGEEYHFTLIPALAVPFAILVVFAIIGCRSLFRNQSDKQTMATDSLASES